MPSGAEIDPGFSRHPGAPALGLSAARTPRRQRSVSSRGRHISRAIGQRQQAAGGGGRSGGPRSAVSSNAQPELGAQLSRRVSSGAIDQPQADQVARDRALLEQVYGPDWRTRVFGGRGIVRNARQNLARDPSNPQLQAFNTRLKQDRKAALERARRKAGVDPDSLY